MIWKQEHERNANVWPCRETVEYHFHTQIVDYSGNWSQGALVLAGIVSGNIEVGISQNSDDLRHNERAIEVFERGVAAIALSVDLWLAYLTFYKDYVKGSEVAERRIR